MSPYSIELGSVCWWYTQKRKTHVNKIQKQKILLSISNSRYISYCVIPRLDATTLIATLSHSQTAFFYKSSLSMRRILATSPEHLDIIPASFKPPNISMVEIQKLAFMYASGWVVIALWLWLKWNVLKLMKSVLLPSLMPRLPFSIFFERGSWAQDYSLAYTKTLYGEILDM